MMPGKRPGNKGAPKNCAEYRGHKCHGVPVTFRQGLDFFFNKRKFSRLLYSFFKENCRGSRTYPGKEVGLIWLRF
jgi:hypothetical protein